MDLLRIAARVEAATARRRSAADAAQAADAWHNDLAKPLRSLLDRSTALMRFLPDLTPEAAQEVLQTVTKWRGTISEMSKDVSRTMNLVADLIASKVA